MRIIYNIGILLFTALIRFVSPFNHKARLWINGRKGWAETLRQKLQPGTGYIWIHCASLGEFEQGRPLIEAIKKHWPGARILLTFFSPSGYEIRKDYSLADVITYLPSDSPFNAKRFTRLVNPVMALFVKYEFWYNYINELKRRNIPVYLVSAIFRKDQHFFKWYGRFFYKILQMFSMIYVQDLFSYRLLKEHGIEHTEVAGDTRFDRVSRIAENAEEIQVISEFRGDEKLFIAGSS